MHVILVIAAGALLLSVFVLFGWLWGASAASMALASKAFLPVWFVLVCINMWVGVNHAGYGVRDELPILLLVFAVPALAASTAIWWLSRG